VSSDLLVFERQMMDGTVAVSVRTLGHYSNPPPPTGVKNWQ
jgi:hypothetical protein